VYGITKVEGERKENKRRRKRGKCDFDEK